MNDCVYKFISWWKCPMRWKRLFNKRCCNMQCKHYISVNTKHGRQIYHNGGEHNA